MNAPLYGRCTISSSLTVCFVYHAIIEQCIPSVVSSLALRTTSSARLSASSAGPEPAYPHSKPSGEW